MLGYKQAKSPIGPGVCKEQVARLPLSEKQCNRIKYLRLNVLHYLVNYTTLDKSLPELHLIYYFCTAFGALLVLPIDT